MKVPPVPCALLALLMASCAELHHEPTPPAAASGATAFRAYQAYAPLVGARMMDALNEPRKRGLYFDVPIQVWISLAGKIERLEFSTGDDSVDEAIRTALTDLDLGPPPPGIPMPMHLHLRARPQ